MDSLSIINARLTSMGALEEALRGLLRDGILRSSSSIAVASRQAAEGLLE